MDECEVDDIIDEPVPYTRITCEIFKEWSDPRLDGVDVTMRNDSDLDELQVFHSSHVIETDHGAWRMRPQIRFEFEGSPEVQEGPSWWVLDGDGTYEPAPHQGVRRQAFARVHRLDRSAAARACGRFDEVAAMQPRVRRPSG
jgi:hypothetical protein